MRNALRNPLDLLTSVAALARKAHLPAQLCEALLDVVSDDLPCLSVASGLLDGEDGLFPRDQWPDPDQWPERLKRTRPERMLVCAGSRGGHAVWLALGPAGEDRVLLDRELSAALSRIIGALLDNTHVVERLADVSRRAHVENRLLKTERRAVERPVAVSAAMRRVVELVDLVARESATVLLRGETGTGKEVFARRIHTLSSRSLRPMLKVNCGALPDTLIESALFGHERGAFTGATQRHVGLFERAHGGTLFLDEVAELPLAAQVKLLRVLQEGEIERVGGTATLKVDVRIIAATHRRIEELVSSGRFREDLYYRLNVFPISIPPLRERSEDLPALVDAILSRLCERDGSTKPRLTAATLERLVEHAWPGNVRELENLIERSRILSRGEVLKLAPDFEPVPSAAQNIGRTEPVASFREWEKRGIEQVLAETSGRIYGPGGAAERLELKPTTLQSKIRKLKIRREKFVAR
jgi:transcriptional regulator with GAF, ATPase, and Fis domain